MSRVSSGPDGSAPVQLCVACLISFITSSMSTARGGGRELHAPRRALNRHRGRRGGRCARLAWWLPPAEYGRLDPFELPRPSGLQMSVQEPRVSSGRLRQARAFGRSAWASFRTCGSRMMQCSSRTALRMSCFVLQARVTPTVFIIACTTLGSFHQQGVRWRRLSRRRCGQVPPYSPRELYTGASPANTHSR